MSPLRRNAPPSGSIALLLAMAVIGCQEIESTEYDTPIRTGPEVRAELMSACIASIGGKQPMLVEFSASWCTDCQMLHRMKNEEALARELAAWPTVVINIGHFDTHPDLLKSFGVRGIAHWSVLAPEDCDDPVDVWPELARRTLEPTSGEGRNISQADLAGWLRALRQP